LILAKKQGGQHGGQLHLVRLDGFSMQKALKMTTRRTNPSLSALNKTIKADNTADKDELVHLADFLAI